MALLNGRIPRAALSPITRAANGEQAYLAHNAAKAFMAMNAESEHRFGVTLRVTSARTAYRPYSDQVFFWNLYVSGRGNLAARPGSSNHGYGVAVDLANPRMRSIVDQIGAKYGWAKKWSDAPSEWWHIKYRPGVWNGKSPYAAKPTVKPGATGKKAVQLKKAMHKHGLKKFKVHTPVYGPTAVAAIKRLQKKHHLKADGIVGAKTWKLLS
jgi:D-alanyl-D-alanine dipeptidase